MRQIALRLAIPHQRPVLVNPFHIDTDDPALTHRGIFAQEMDPAFKDPVHAAPIPAGIAHHALAEQQRNGELRVTESTAHPAGRTLTDQVDLVLAEPFPEKLQPLSGHAFRKQRRRVPPPLATNAPLAQRHRDVDRLREPMETGTAP